MRDGFALGGGPYHFFERSSRSADASSIWSTSSFFSFAFSSSKAFRGYWTAIQQVLNKYDILLIADEVIWFRANR